MKCVVGAWVDGLDADDTASFGYAQDVISRVDLHKLIIDVEGWQVFGLTALKTHITEKCVCFRSNDG